VIQIKAIQLSLESCYLQHSFISRATQVNKQCSGTKIVN